MCFPNELKFLFFRFIRRSHGVFLLIVLFFSLCVAAAIKGIYWDASTARGILFMFQFFPIKHRVANRSLSAYEFYRRSVRSHVLCLFVCAQIGARFRKRSHFNPRQRSEPCSTSVTQLMWCCVYVRECVCVFLPCLCTVMATKDALRISCLHVPAADASVSRPVNDRVDSSRRHQLSGIIAHSAQHHVFRRLLQTHLIIQVAQRSLYPC